MARSIPGGFDADSTMSPHSAGGISYSTNVNRQKTKKWAEAKPVNYGGDDYGDEDDYDYDYDPTPPPVAKPTGLRQQGQALQGPAKADSPSFDNKKYGELPPLPGANQPSHNRSHSFDPEDEKRNFSSATMRQPSPPTTESPSNPPATQFSQMTGVPPSPAARNFSGPPLQISTQSASQPPPAALRKSSQVVSPVSGSPHPDILNVGRADSGESSFVSPTSDARTPTSDYHTRRDFSPSAVPQPLTTRSPAPQSATDSPSTNFPPRKSSISQAAGPDLADTSGPSQAQTASKPWSAAPRSSSPGAAARSPGAPASKALPIIRPVDIYRRMEEERQKERQSMESGRPSMDSIVGAKASERSESPAKSNLRDSSTDSLGQRRSRTSLETDDGSESGRQRPVLEPVKERKSEHDFEGFNVNEQNTQPLAESHEEDRTSLEQHHLDVEEVRRFSTSPKLPDLNRISGFGMDLFSPSKPEDSYSFPSKDKEITPSGPPTSANTEDFTLHTQPTFGFRSVVNQAFDRTEDSSVPNTPASQPASGPSRSVSESTGTDGISPIMSRVPSAAVQNRNRDPSNPSILEVVNEPDSLEEPPSQQESEGPPSGFRPRYRGEISTPGRENSPARHPDLAKTNIITSGQHAVVSETSPDEEPLQPPRPIVEREQSFRPVLPGGWTSYATSATSDVTSQAPIERKQTPISRKQTPVIEATPIEERRQSDDYDITPTTTRNPLPKSASSAAVAGALGSIAGAALGKHDKSSPSETPTSQSPRVLHSNKDLPTPDPVGNLYSMTNADPRLPPKLEQAPPETQLRPDAVHRDNSDESSVAPPPLPKDTPKQESLDNDSDYFPKPTVPLKQRTLNEAQSLELPQRPAMVPTLSSDTRSYDEETDKLRKEIVKSLSRPTTADQHRGSMMVGGLDDGPSSKPGHESTYLPSEYDNYWASTGEDEEPVPAIARRESNQEELHHSETVSSVATEHSVQPEVNSPVIAPLSPRRPEAAEDYPRPSLPQRFSWEEGSEDVSIPQVESTPMGVTSAANNHPRETTNTVPAIVASADSDPRQSSPVGTGPGFEGGENRVEQKTLSDHHFGRDAALVAGGAAAMGAAAVTEQGPKSPPTQERRLSLAEEKDPRVSSYPVSPTPPEDEHPANSPAPYLSPFTTEFTHAPSTVSAGSSPAKAPLSPSGSKLYAFKEIVNMQSPQQRIRTFEETRHRWANMDSGLIEWMTSLQAQYPEHASASGAFTGSRVVAPVGSARSKFSKAPGGGAQPLQEPYYQHYLNASPTTPSTPTRPGPAPGAPSFQTGSQQGFSPAGNKLTTQQVQAKGKEFLHSAGIFGGKAGKAGKGLLAKGKNKLRGAGGGDKESPPLKPKPEKGEKLEKERRSSWGLPLGLARSSGRPDSSTRLSKDNTPVLTPERGRVQPDVTLDHSSTVPQLPPLPTDHSFGSMSGALPADDLSHRYLDVPVPSQPESEEDGYAAGESRDTLGVPAPIGKYQPSWDPFNATPIAEEEGFHYEELPKPPRQISSESAPQQASLNVPRDSISKSDRSNSSDVHFYDAREEQADIANDWVMVPKKDVVVEEDQAYGEPGVTPEGEPESNRSVEAPVTSILNRPRGSSYVLPSPPPSARSATLSTSPPPASVSALTLPPAKQAPSSLLSSAKSTNPPAAPVTSFIQPPTQIAPQSQPQLQPQPQSQEQASSGFLPPIRRTSTFGLSLSSKQRQPKQRFPIEDDDDEPMSHPQQKGPEHHGGEIAAAPGATAVVAALALHDAKIAEPSPPKLSESPASLPPQSPTLTAPAAKPTIDSQAQPSQPQQAPFTDSPRRVPPIDTTVHQQTPISQQPDAARPPLIQAGSSEYSSPSERPALSQAGSSEYSQRTMTAIPQQNQPQPQLQQPPPPRFGPPRVGDVAFRPQNQETSHVEWKPNRSKAGAAPPFVPASPSTWSKEQDIGPPPARSSLDQSSHRRQNSWEAQRGRGYSGSSQSYTKGIEDYGEKTPYVASPIQQKPFEQPPSAAQRYPDLFRPENQSPNQARETDDLPAHYYQAPINRVDAFLPRQQTNEYQLPGVGPPPEVPNKSPTKRGSGFFREIGGKLSRGSSRERSGSIPRDVPLSSPTRPFESPSRANEYAESEAPSEAAVEQKRRRSGFFGIKRSSTSGLGAPVSQESVIAHPPSSQLASRTSLLATPQQTPPQTSQQSSGSQQERKRSIFGSQSAEPKPPKVTPNKLTRASTGTSNSGGPGSVDDSKKKQRFSGLGGKLFGKPSGSGRDSLQEQRPQTTRQVSHAERQPLESPGFSPGMNLQAPSQSQTPSPNLAPPSQSRTIMSRFNSSSPSPGPRQNSKTRKASTSGISASGILGGLMGRRPQQSDRVGSDSSRSGGGSQSNLVPHQVPAAQTYSDLQREQQQDFEQQYQQPPPPQAARPPRQVRQASREIPFQDPSIPTPDRGRRVSREPQYDQVPIPGGYALVRGQGAMPAPRPTEYESRGFNQQQVDPRYAQHPAQGSYNQSQGGGYPLPNGQQYQGIGNQYQSSPPLQGGRQQPKPTLSNIETYASASASRRLSREDLLARSPPQTPEGQQRPYQLSLPDEDQHGQRPAPNAKHPSSFPSPPIHGQPLKHDAIQRLQQPTLRHPESPAGYPLPDDTVFSPINPAAQNLPDPPPPRWPSQRHAQQNQDTRFQHERGHSLTQSLSTVDIDLDRSNTRRTAVSAVSGISDPQNPMSIQSARGSLNVPGRNGSVAKEEEQDIRNLRSSPTPPSPMGSPSREVSPEPVQRVAMEGGGDTIKRTELHVRQPSGEDLYSASPRMPPKKGFPPVSQTSSERASSPALGNENMQRMASNASSQVLPSSHAAENQSPIDALGVRGGPPQQPVIGGGLGRGQGSTIRREVLRKAQEEKILIGEDGQEVEVVVDENAPPSMSATSYPGQEWNPYAMGGYEEFD